MSTIHSAPTRRNPSRSSSDELDSENVAESTRLLPATLVPTDVPGELPLHHDHSKTARRTPVPKTQLGALLLVRIAEPLTLTQLAPYINQFLVDIHVAGPESVGFYSGLVESAHSLPQIFSAYLLGRLSDVVGHRLVMSICLVGIALSTIMIGLSTTFFGIVTWKFIGGFLAGSTAVINSMLAEIMDETNQHLVMPIFSIAWPVGTVIGPLIGGIFENAAAKYPRYFAWTICVEYPYLLPCLITAVGALLGAGLGYTLIEETTHSKRKSASGTAYGLASSQSSLSRPDSDQAGIAILTFREVLSVPALRLLAISGFGLSVLSFAFDAIFALFCYSAVGFGGLGFEPWTIGQFLAFAGMIAVVLRVLALSYVLHNFDYAKTYWVCMMMWPFAFAAFPILNAIARYQLFGTETATTAVIWIGLGISLALSKVAAIAYMMSIVLIKQHAPSPSSLGQSNGVVQFGMCLGHVVGPVLVSALFTVCNGSEWARQNGLAWTWAGAMVCLSLAGARVAKELVD